MSIRVLFCFIYVIGFSFYAWKNWYYSLCATVLLMAFFQHPDMPKSIGGIQGLNPWNILMLNVTLAWLSQRGRSGHRWDLPWGVAFMMVTFVTVIVWSFSRLAADPSNLPDYSFLSALSENVINNTKWILVCVIFFDSCRTQRQVYIAVLTVLALYFLLAVQVVRWVPLGAAVSGDEEFARLAYKLIQNEVGYNRVTISMILGGASWSTLAFYMVVDKENRRARLALLAVAGIITMGQALTGGRTGYVSWAAVGLVLCALRWRRLLLFVPVVVLLVAVFLPGVRDRMMFGMGGEGGEADSSKMTSGRTTIWPYVLENIGDAPILGYGRMAMQRNGLTDWLLEELGEDNFGHPHNAYLELLLDNGLVGLMGILPLYLLVARRSFKLFLDKSNALFTLVGGACSAQILALLVGALAGQTFYPREGAAGMWALVGIMLRVSVENARSRATGEPLFGEYDEEYIEEGSYDEAESNPQSV